MAVCSHEGREPVAPAGTDRRPRPWQANQRRIRRSSGNPDIGMNLLAPFEPETMHDAVEIIFDAQTDQLTYDEVRAKSPFEMQAYGDWLAKIRESKEPSAPFFRCKSRGGTGSQSREQS
jgi:hypothetical protein